MIWAGYSAHRERAGSGGFLPFLMSANEQAGCKETYQFNDMNAKKAVIRLYSDFNIPIDSVQKLNASITQIYIDKCISDILSDNLDKCGGGYNFDMTPNGIKKQSLIEKLKKFFEKYLELI